MEYQNIILSIKDGIAYLILNKPKVLNALSWEMIQEIKHAAENECRRDEVRAVIVAGEGENFAAGADIVAMVNRAPEEAKKFVFNAAFNAIEEIPVPVIAAISGYALGGGLELALACDFRFCKENAKLGMPEIKLGIFPGAGGTQRLPKLIGVARAKRMIYLGEMIDAKTAFEWGLCDEVVSGNPIDAAVDFAKKISNCPQIAIRQAKRVINYGIYSEVKKNIAFEEEAWSALFATDDQKEGMRAFLEKRKPKFKGL
ncbi:MAG: enoyl-CoA hydratase-related protein [Spirochaetes bacterium]|nr:enoyl-CoA hydratase-related protein [Spirochaetota bacterium]